MAQPLESRRAPSAMEDLSSDVPPNGYPQIAKFMSEYPEMLMVRRFRGLNARNLLYLQAELVQIEKDLLRCERADAKDENNPEKRAYAKDFWWLVNSSETEDNEQWRLIQKMKEKLKEYNDVLIQQATLSRVQNPSRYDMETIDQWFIRQDLADMPLEGDDGSIYANPGRLPRSKLTSRHVKDLIAVNGNDERVDKATTWFLSTFFPFIRAHLSQYLDFTIVYAIFARIVSLVATVIASLFLVIGIVILYFVKSDSARLGVVAALTATLSISLALMTPDRRTDNFAATAAFAAVQVVFVGTTGNGTSSG